MAEEHAPRPGRLKRHLARWAGIYLAALMLLGLSQVVWEWQSWPVRHLLETGR